MFGAAGRWLKQLPLSLPFFAKVAISGFLLGNREKIAVVANDDFFRWAGNMAEKMNRQAPTSNLQRNSKLQNAFGALVIGDSLVLGWWVLDVARETETLPNPRTSASICATTPVFKIKNLVKKSKLAHQTQSNLIKGLLMKKIPNFFPGTLMGKHWEIRKKYPKKHVKLPKKTCDL